MLFMLCCYLFIYLFIYWLIGRRINGISGLESCFITFLLNQTYHDDTFYAIHVTLSAVGNANLHLKLIDDTS